MYWLAPAQLKSNLVLCLFVQDNSKTIIDDVFQENSFLLKAVSCSELDILQLSECVSIFGIQNYIRAGIFPYLVSTQELYSSDQNPLSCAFCHVLLLGRVSPKLMLMAEGSLQVFVLISKCLANNFIIKYDIGIKSGS